MLQLEQQRQALLLLKIGSEYSGTAAATSIAHRGTDAVAGVPC